MSLHTLAGTLDKLNPNWMNTTQTAEVILFSRTVTLTSAAAATAVSIIADSEVPAGFTPYILNFRAQVNGGTPWATTATVKIQDTAGTPVDFVTFAVAGLTANAYLVDNTANVTLGTAYSLNTGGTAGKGLRVVGNANGTGSNLVVTVVGIYVKS